MSGKDGAKDEPASLSNSIGMIEDLLITVFKDDKTAIKFGLEDMGHILYWTVENSHEISDKVGKPIYEWVHVDGKKVPQNALPAAKEYGNDVYVGRGILEGSKRLGKYHAQNGQLFVAHLGEEKLISENIEVLCVDKDDMVEWAKIAKSIYWGVFKKILRGDKKTKGMLSNLMMALVPPKDVEAIKASFAGMSTVLGSVVEGATKVVVQKNKPASLNKTIDLMGELIMAVVPTKDIQAIKAGFKEMGNILWWTVQNSHEIPDKVGKPTYEWVHVDGKKVPENALPAAKEYGNDVYVGRGILEGSKRLGKYHAQNGQLFVAHLGEEKEISENIEVLCVDKDDMVEWVKITKSIWRVLRKIYRRDRKTKSMMRDLMIALVPPKDVEAIKASFAGMSTVLGSVVEGAARRGKPICD